MSKPFSPRLESLPPPQRALWDELVEVPRAFTLWGGTAIALHLGHRTSVDFDFFSTVPVDLDAVLREVPFLRKAKILQREPNTLTCAVSRRGPLKLSFFVVQGALKPIKPPHVCAGNDLQIAALIDLAAMKAKVVQDRPEAKDYIDIDAMIASGGISLAKALSAAALVYGSSYAPIATLKALSFFDDGNLATLPKDARARLVAAVRAVDLGRLPKIARSVGRKPGQRK